MTEPPIRRSTEFLLKSCVVQLADCVLTMQSAVTFIAFSSKHPNAPEPQKLVDDSMDRLTERTNELIKRLEALLNEPPSS